MKSGRPYQRLTRGAVSLRVGGGIVLLLLTAAACLLIGPTSTTPAELWDAVFGKVGGQTDAVLFDLRLPRILLAGSVGAALAVCGLLFQALLRNPLAEPYILGISNGCAVGAILGYMFGLAAFFIPVLSFLGGFVVVLVVLVIGRSPYGTRSESLLLGGVMVGAIGAALIFLFLYLLGDQVRSAIQWMLGDLSTASRETGYLSSLLLLVLLTTSFFFGDLLNALALGEEEAAGLGVNVERARIGVYLAGSLIVGLAVSVSGAIGFIGLVVPHILRRLFGADHRLLLPATVIGGAVFLILCDTVARSFLSALGPAGGELPVGAVTALIGAPTFIYLLRRTA